MSRSLLRTSAVLFAVFAAGTVLLADPPRPAPPAAPPGAPPAVNPSDPAAMPQVWRAKQILGMKVNIANNTAVGTVEDIVFSDGGDVEYLVVQTSDGKLFSVPWAAATHNADQKLVVVNITPEQFKTIPTYTATTYPQFFTPTYRNDVYKFYGVTPREFRRIERRINR